ISRNILYLQTIDDICNMTIYKSCMNITETPQFEECANHCLQSCEKLSITVKNSYFYFPGNWELTKIRIYIDNMNMVVLDEQLALSWEKVLELIGGTIGFFLRYSLYDMLCFAFLLLMKLFILLIRKAKLVLTNIKQLSNNEVNPASEIMDDHAEQNA